MTVRVEEEREWTVIRDGSVRINGRDLLGRGRSEAVRAADRETECFYIGGGGGL